MISPEYCRIMARYNAWQNSGLRDMLKDMPTDDLFQDRGAFFGSIIATLNHLLWGDTVWISRFDGGESTDLSGHEGLEMTPTPAVWAAERFALDARITLWAQSVQAVDLTGDLTWTSVIVDGQMTKPKGVCVMQFFNHQTHHRGQVHAMLTALGKKPAATDIPFMPEGA